NQSGCSAERTMQVVVHPKPLAQIGFPAVICEGQTQVSLTDNSSVPGGAGQINNWWWNLDGSITTVQTPPPFTINSYLPFPVKLVVKTAAGCVSDTAVQTLQVRRKPIPAFEVGRALCENELLHFTDRSLMPAGATGEQVMQWNWQFDNTGTATVQNPDYQFSAGPHRVRLTATSNFGCNSNVLDSTITIQSKPAVSVTLSDSCAGKTILFTAQGVSGNVTKWYWNFGGGFTQGERTATRFFNRAATGTL
ncbi:MAG: hypothetical protein JNM68_13995, partial [Dinghuibacter sp.]|nr:hypothetical protein [Dinghuibacter sp.]